MKKYEQIFPRWAREMERYLPMKSLFFIYKNIYDIYFYPQKVTNVIVNNILCDDKEKNEKLMNFFKENADRYAFDKNKEEISLKGCMLNNDRQFFYDLYNDKHDIILIIDKLYMESRDFLEINDNVPITWIPLNLNSYLNQFLAMKGYSIIAYYDIVDGFTFPYDNKIIKDSFMKLVKGKEDTIDADRLEKSQTNTEETKSRLPTFQQRVKIDDALTMIRNALGNKDIPVAVILRFSSRILSSPSHLTPDENKNFVKLMKIGEESMFTFMNDIQRRNLIICVSEKLNDLPAWLYLENPQSKALQVDLPDIHERHRFFQIMKPYFYKGDELSDLLEIEKIENTFSDITMGMSNVDLENIRNISNSEKVPITKIKNAIERYKYGIIESEWDKIEKSKLHMAEEILRKRVKGQEEAILHVLDVIKRAKIGLSGIHQSSSSNKPRGILFFAGPTGVGKTELAKALAEFLFGDEKKCIRFDMSEYAQEQSDQKLLGAPPGYVGYEEGGQLTNAVKANPFSVLLFDEIEKAHPKIFDKFLQILDDGRMTDGKGETVYFSESLIIFTSNLGTYVPDENGKVIQNTNPAMPYPEIKQRIFDAITDYFNYTLRRPELLNRFGENFIVFDYIRENIATEIIEKILGNFKEYLLKEKQINIIFEKPIYDFICQQTFQKLDFGGRGIGNVIEKFIVNPFSRYIFDNDIQGETNLVIKNITSDKENSVIKLEIIQNKGI
ncbi:MAG TPA: AAA family ATPase [Exilispira sp.]|nr:AAA family ATPase [Exilispira sp.]